MAADNKDADDLKKAENDRKVQENREKAEAEKACITATEARGATVVRKGGKDAGNEMEKTDAIKANLDSQSTPKASTGRCVTVATGWFARNVWDDTSVDAGTAINDVNKDNESDYVCLVINGLLKLLDCIASDGTIRKYISVARHYINIVCSSISPETVTSLVTNDDEIIPDSGTTSHMRKDISVFEDDYVACSNVFVLIGNGAEIPVLGYGTSHMRIDSHVTLLLNGLHVP